MRKGDKSEVRYVGGLHPVRSALKHGAEHIVAVWYDQKRHDKRLRQLVAEMKQQKISLSAVDRSELDKRLPDTNHQGVIAETRVPSARAEPDLYKLLDELDEPFLILILDGVQDPHNLGACLRTADASGVNALIVPKDRSVGLTPTVCKVASGAAETVPFFQVTNLARTMQRLRDEYRLWVTGTSGDAENLIYELDLKGNVAIVMGSEGSGMRRLTAEHCDQLARIPMLGEVESLNVSAATAVCLYEAIRQRSK